MLFTSSVVASFFSGSVVAVSGFFLNVLNRMAWLNFLFPPPIVYFLRYSLFIIFFLLCVEFE